MAKVIAGSTGELKIAHKKDALDLSPTEKEMFAAVGYFVNETAKLERAIDDFILTYARYHKNDQIVKSRKKHPFKMDEKIDFIVGAFVECAELRKSGDADGFLSLNWIGFAIEEVWDARHDLVHGGIFSSTHGANGDFHFRSDRIVKPGTEQCTILSNRISRNQIASFVKRIAYLRALISHAAKVAEGVQKTINADDIRKGQARLREMLQDAAELKVYEEFSPSSGEIQ